jgi:hypothetical protein
MEDNCASIRRFRHAALVAPGQRLACRYSEQARGAEDRNIRNGASVFLTMRSREEVKKLALLLAVLVLGACGDTQTAFVSEGNSDQSISVVREQSHAGGAWQSTLIVAGLPQCQRRFALQDAGTDSFRIDVYRPGPGLFILKAGKRWDVVELKSCGYQTYKTPPPEPGELVGSFEMAEGKLRYSAKPGARPGKPAQ